MLLIEEVVSVFLEGARTTERDRDLVIKAAYGDGAAIGILTTRMGPALTRVANMHSKDKHLADDAVQDVLFDLVAKKFSKVGAALSQGAPVDLLFSTLAKATMFKVRRQMKKKRVGVIHKTAGDTLKLVGAAPASTGLSGTERRMVRRIVMQAKKAANLKDKEREFIDAVFGVEAFDDPTRFQTKGAKATMSAVVAQVWPDVPLSTAIGRGNKVRDRFLKQFCKNKDLRAMLSTGHQRRAQSRFFHASIKPVCGAMAEECCVAYVFGLVENVELQRYAVGDALMGWLRAALA